jgi:glutamine amidotransferase
MILIIDYGMGNIHSVRRKLERLKVDCLVSSDPSDIKKAEKIILPGVGHFGKAMQNLKEQGLIEPLNEAVLADKKPILGICLGLQLMTRGSEEGLEKRSETTEKVEGLGWFDAEVVRMQPKDTLRYKIPHTGWNSLEYTKDDPILKDVPSGSEMYFVHGYGVLTAPEAEILTRTTYEKTFVSTLKKDHIVGMQFHPEKSHEAGLTLLKNFVFLNERMQK